MSGQARGQDGGKGKVTGSARLEEVKAALARHGAELRAQGVKSLAVFGSVARGEAGPSSDVDLLVEFDRPTGIFGMLHVQYRLEEILGVKVDLVTRSGVHPALRGRIYTEAVNALEVVAVPPERYPGGYLSHPVLYPGDGFEQLRVDRKTVDAVERNFIVVGEAARHVPDEVTARYPSVPWRNMRDMRNVVVHGYRWVDLERVWEAIQQDLPPLVPLLREILEQKRED